MLFRSVSQSRYRGSGWFIGTKTWESHTSATEIEKSLRSKTFQDGKNCPVIVLDPETNYGFSEIKQLIPAVVDDVVKQKKGEEDTKYQKAYRKYQDEINKGKPATQPHRGSPVVFGVEIEPKKNLIDHVLDFMEFDMRIQFVIPLSLLILGSGWFIGTIVTGKQIGRAHV